MCTLLTSAEIAENIKKQAKAQHIVIKSLLESQHIGRNIINEMYKGRYPRIDTIARIAAGLGCTVDALIYSAPADDAADPDGDPADAADPPIG